MERKSEVKTFVVDYLCENENCSGVLEQVGKIEWINDPIVYPHKCKVCDKEYSLLERYPRLIYDYV